MTARAVNQAPTLTEHATRVFGIQAPGRILSTPACRAYRVPIFSSSLISNTLFEHVLRTNVAPGRYILAVRCPPRHKFPGNRNPCHSRHRNRARCTRSRALVFATQIKDAEMICVWVDRGSARLDAAAAGCLCMVSSWKLKAVPWIAHMTSLRLFLVDP